MKYLNLMLLILAAVAARVANPNNEIYYDPSAQMTNSLFANYGFKRDGMSKN